MNTRQKLEVLKANFEKVEKSDKDYHAKRYDFLKESYKLKSEFLSNFVEYFNLTTSKDFKTDNYTFCLWIQLLNYSTYENICIRNIKDISTALQLVKKLNRVGICVTLCYTRPCTWHWSNRFSKIESFSSYSSFNYHARYVLRTWDINKENNVSNWDWKMFIDEKYLAQNNLIQRRKRK